jgi:hypothetical protein
MQRDHSKHFEDAVFEYFDLAVRISKEDFQIGADLMKADVFGLETSYLIYPELSVSDFQLNKIQYNLHIQTKNFIEKKRILLKKTEDPSTFGKIKQDQYDPKKKNSPKFNGN